MNLALFLLILIAVNALLLSVFLWIATRLTHNPMPPVKLFLIAFVSVLALVVPLLGPVLAIVILGLLLSQVGEMDLWPDTAIVLLISLALLWGSTYLLGWIMKALTQ